MTNVFLYLEISLIVLIWSILAHVHNIVFSGIVLSFYSIENFRILTIGLVKALGQKNFLCTFLVDLIAYVRDFFFSLPFLLVIEPFRLAILELYAVPHSGVDHPTDGRVILDGLEYTLSL